MYNINFTMSQDQSAITFLDLKIYKTSRFNQHGIRDIKLLLQEEMVTGCAMNWHLIQISIMKNV